MFQEPDPDDDVSDEDWEQYLHDKAAEFFDDPLGFVLWAFPWGKGDLSEEKGPDEWQIQLLIDLGEESEEREFDGHTPCDPIRMAVGSGHGIGKTALCAWLILWIMFTRPNCSGTVAASTVRQLTTKTVPELQKWLGRALFKDWFRCDNEKIVSRGSDNPLIWRCDFQSASKDNSEAFAGQHAADSTSFYIFDESSGVPDGTQEVSEGGLTDGQPMVFAFGNRTQPGGWFQDCFGKLAHRWINYCIDSRTAKMTNKRQIAQWAEDWGEEADFFRVRVMGLPPGQAPDQMISLVDIEAAQIRPARTAMNAPMTMGIDVARYGEDETVFVFRKGNDARTHPAVRHRKLSTTEVADSAAGFIRELGVDVVFVDGGGIGGGVVDNLEKLGFQNIVEINFGGRSSDNEFYDKRTQMWGNLKKELQRGLAIENDDDLRDQLLVQDYVIDRKKRNTRMVSKEDLRRMGESSPDWGDALALTYAEETPDSVPDAGLKGARTRGRANEDRFNPHGNVNRH